MVTWPLAKFLWTLVYFRSSLINIVAIIRSFLMFGLLLCGRHYES